MFIDRINILILIFVKILQENLKHLENDAYRAFSWASTNLKWTYATQKENT